MGLTLGKVLDRIGASFLNLEGAYLEYPMKHARHMFVCLLGRSVRLAANPRHMASQK